MSEYKVGDKVVYEVKEIIRDNVYFLSGWKESEPLSTYTEPLEAKIRRQAAEITRLLAENERLKAENKKMGVKLDAYELYGDQHEEEYNQAFNQGADKAWELARKIASTAGGLSSSELIKIFNSFLPRDILSENTYPEAAAKVSAWERQKEEIKVGDVYEGSIGSRCFAIRNIDEETNNVEILWIDLSSGNRNFEEIKQYKKTGRHIDIDSFLKQIGGEE